MVIAISETRARQQSALLREEGKIPPRRIEYIGTRPSSGGAGQPQAFTIEMTPNEEFGPHYHTVDQYQLILHGDGRIGRRPLSTYSVHYTDRYTSYGPLVAGEHSMHYMTLRAKADPGPQYLSRPGVREAQQPSLRRFRLQADIGVLDSDEVNALAEPLVTPLIGPDDDGMQSLAIRLAPGMPAPLPDPASGAGQYLFVMAGELRLDDEVLDRHATIFVPADEPAPVLRAGAAGAQLLLMQFPRQAA